MSGSGGGTPRTSSRIDLGVAGLSDPILIGQGGFGAVYRAEQPALGRTVAVKVLSAPGFDDRTRVRFERECMAVGALSGHPHIVTVYDSGINSWGRPFIVMDFMSRGSIADRIALDGPIAWPEAVDMGVKLCGAVATAHAAGILHRDVKPQNVLVSAYGEPKLGDFGISSIGGEQTSSGTVTASLEHAAPELLDGAPATVASDVYALASTMFTMIAGHSPFAREPEETIQSLIARVVGEPVPDLRPRGVPGALCDVLERALAKDPANRIASCSELGATLRGVQELQGLTPTPVIETETVGGFEVLDRFVPGGSGHTAPTRTRVRNAYVAPTPPVPPVPLWRRPVFVATAAFVLLAVAAGAFALTRGTPDRKTPSVAAVADASPDPVEDLEDRSGDAAAKGSDGGRKNKKARDGERSSAPGLAGGAGSVGGIPAPAPDSAGSGTDSDQAGTTTGSQERDGDGRSGGGTSGGGEPKEQEPKHPPAPNVWLYHVWKGRDHAATTNPSAYPDYARAAEGLVYNYREEGTVAIPTAEGTMYVFAEQYGDTEPDVHRYTLFKLTKGDEYFYTSNSEKRDNYTFNWDWSATTAHFIGKTS